MYFRDKEELFRYLLRGYVDQMVMVIEELLLRRRGRYLRVPAGPV
jgi:AcrR family transcriptional regulator